LDRKVCFSNDMRLFLSAALISETLFGGTSYFALTARGAKIFGPRICESAARVRGEDGALIVLASEGGAPKLETDDTD